MVTLPVKCETVDLDTGQVTKSEMVGFSIMPPPAAACQICARNPAHGADEPHDAQSLFYQYRFYAEHDRWPTWKDAVAHCSERVRAAWEAELRRRGHWPLDEQVASS